MKVHILSFLYKTVIAKSQQTNLTKSKQFIESMKQLVPIIKKMLEDSVPEVRESSIMCLGKIKPYLSE